MNLPALYNRRPHIDSKPASSKREGENMNTKWPGKEDGTLIERIVYKINKEIVENCDYCIDLHSWTHFWATTSLPIKMKRESLELAEISRIKFINPRIPEKKYPNTLSAIAFLNNKISLTIEFSGQYQINEKEVKTGIRALKNICKYLGVIKGKLEGQDEKIVWLDRCKAYEIKSETTGLFIKNEKIKLGDYVKKGDVLGWIFNEKTLKTLKIYSHVNGFLYHFGAHRINCDIDLAACHPFVTEGEILCKIIGSKNG